MITNDRNVLVIILDINSRGLKKVKASIQNITKQYSNIIVKVYFKKDDIPIDLIETIRYIYGVRDSLIVYISW